NISTTAASNPACAESKKVTASCSPPARRTRRPRRCPASIPPTTRPSKPTPSPAPPPTARNPASPSRWPDSSNFRSVSSSSSALSSQPGIRGPGRRRLRFCRRKQFRFCQAPFRQLEFQPHVQAAEAVFHAAAEIDGRRFLEILRRAAYLANREPVPQNLRQHLIV